MTANSVLSFERSDIVEAQRVRQAIQLRDLAWTPSSLKKKFDGPAMLAALTTNLQSCRFWDDLQNSGKLGDCDNHADYAQSHFILVSPDFVQGTRFCKFEKLVCSNSLLLLDGRRETGAVFGHGLNITW